MYKPVLALIAPSASPSEPSSRDHVTLEGVAENCTVSPSLTLGPTGVTLISAAAFAMSTALQTMS